jgi:hypothetical protein
MSTHSARDSYAKHIVLTTFGSYGDVHPYLAIARELQREVIAPQWQPANCIALR